MQGYFADVRLDGLHIAGAYRWPGPVHEGNGTWWSVIDKRATEEQVKVAPFGRGIGRAAAFGLVVLGIFMIVVGNGHY